VRPWDAEIGVDEPLARELIAGQFPELAGAPLESLGEGWDNMAYRVGGEWVFRFPRRQVVVAELEKEIAFLPRLARLVPFCIPEPELIGRPSEAFPWPFFGARFIEGVEAGDADAPREPLARDLGRALRVLHSPAVLDALGPELPESWTQRANMQLRVPRVREQLEAIAELWTAPAKVEEVLEAAAPLPPPEPLAVCHGDLHFRHVLVRDGRVSGLIDWIDLCRGDPGLDLQLVWSFFEPAERDAFFAEYGQAEEQSLLRARVIAFALNGVLAEYSHAEGLPNVEREAIASLERAVCD
jgi:aminoglycoside phosphotransferase (APT) family kinase protein